LSAFSGEFRGHRVHYGMDGTQQDLIHLAGANHIADRPIGLRKGDLIHQDQNQVVGGKFAAGETG